MAESRRNYIDRVGLNYFIQWIVAECLLNRPEDPLEFSFNIIEEKLKAPYRQPFSKRIGEFFLDRSYEGAFLKMNKGNTENKTLKKVDSTLVKQEETVSIENYIIPLSTTIKEILTSISLENTKEKILLLASTVFNAKQAGLFFIHGKQNAIILGNDSKSLSLSQPSISAGRGILGSALSRGSFPFIVSNTLKDPLFIPAHDQLGESLTRSMMCGSLLNSNSKPFAVLAVGNRRNDEIFLESELYSFQSLLSLSSSLIHLAEKLEAKNKEGYKYRYMVNIVEASCQKSIAADRMIKILNECLPKIIAADICSTFIVAKNLKEVWTVEEDIRMFMPIDKGLVGDVMTSRKSININDVSKHEGYRKKEQIAIVQADDCEIESVLATPIWSQEKTRIVAVVQLSNKRRQSTMLHESFSDEDEIFLSTFISILGPYFEQLHLREEPEYP